MNSTKLIASTLIVALSVGCAGRTANLVMIHQYGDNKRSCEALEREMIFVQGEVQRLIPQTDKTSKNVVLGILGWFLIIPWFFMDFSKAEQMEIDAFRQRYNRLMMISLERNCDEVKTETTKLDQPQQADTAQDED